MKGEECEGDEYGTVTIRLPMALTCPDSQARSGTGT